MTTDQDVTTLTSTRLALQAVAEHVLAPALHSANGHIGLRRTPGGFGTPTFAVGDRERQLRVDGIDLVVRDGDDERRAPLTTLRAAGEQAGLEPGAPAGVYTPATALDLDAPLAVDTDAARVLADWYALVDEALEALRAASADQDPAPVQLWPEHFDLATTIGECNWGGSPGDATHPTPYLYVGPWDPPAQDGFWNEAFGASRPAAEVVTPQDALAFFTGGQSRLT